MKTTPLSGRPLFFIVSTLLMAVISLGMAHLLVTEYDREDLAVFARHILARGSEVAGESQRIVSDVNAIGHLPCSDGFLKEIRYLSFTSVFISDIGYTRDRQLECTAMRGRLSKPVALSIPDAVTRFGQRIWTSFIGVIDPRITTDMMESGNVLLIPTPAAFRDIYVPYAGLGAVLINHQHNHVFRHFGDTANLMEEVMHPGRLDRWHQAVFRECSKQYDICIMARNQQVGLFSLSVPVILLIAFTGALIGILFTVAVLQFLNNTRSLEKRLRTAIASGDITVQYQPFVAIHSGKTVGYEALARWKNTGGDNIPPDVFIKLAESTHQITALTRSVVGRAIREMAAMLKENRALFLSVNVTTADVTDPDFKIFLEEQIDLGGFDRHQLVLEITERSTADHRLLQDSLVRLREYGYRIAIDDFGTGYSNLDYLSKLSFDIIKIDKMFTDAIGVDSVSFTMMKMMLQMLSEGDATVIVEGIEEPHQADYLLSHYPETVGQGWLFGRPADIPEKPV